MGYSPRRKIVSRWIQESIAVMTILRIVSHPAVLIEICRLPSFRQRRNFPSPEHRFTLLGIDTSAPARPTTSASAIPLCVFMSATTPLTRHVIWPQAHTLLCSSLDVTTEVFSVLMTTLIAVSSVLFATASSCATPLLHAVMAARVNIATHTNIIFFIVLICLLFNFGLLFHLCSFASHHCKTLLQSCKSVSHHCIGHCTAAKWPRTTAKRIYSIAKRPRTIAKRFCSIVSCPCSGAGRNCTAIPPARRAARVPRRPARRRVCGAGRASRSGGSIRGLPASASRGRRPRGGRG